MPIDRDVMVMAISVVDCSVSQTYFSEQHNKMTRDQRYQLKLLLQNLLEAQHTGEEAVQYLKTISSRLKSAHADYRPGS